MLAFLWMLALLAPTRLGAEPTELELRMAELVNIEREARALPRLTFSPRLADAARTYSGVMAAEQRVHHDFDGSVEDRIRSGRPDACLFGENISKHTSIDYSMGDLMLSPGHRANLLNPDFTLIGIGIAEDEDGFLYITLDLAGLCAPRGKTRERDR